MNEVLIKQMSQFLEMLQNGIKTGVNFAGEQIPVLLQEMIKFACIKYALGIVFPLIFFVIVVILHKKFIVNNDHLNIDGQIGFGVIIYIFSLATFIPIFLINLYCFFRVLFAPRLFLMYEIMNIIRTLNINN